MWGWLLAGLIIGAAIVIVVSYLDKSVAKQKAHAEVPDAVKLKVKSIAKDGSTTRVKMSALDEYDNNINDIEFEADEVSSDIYQGQQIYI